MVVPHHGHRAHAQPELTVHTILLRTEVAKTATDVASKFFSLLALSVALVMGGCGGGGGGDRRSDFINFTGSPDGEIVLDVDNEIFRVTEREGCLWSDQYGFVTDWCLVRC